MSSAVETAMRNLEYGLRFLNRHCIPHVEMTIADFPMGVFATRNNLAGALSLAMLFT